MVKVTVKISKKMVAVAAVFALVACSIIAYEQLKYEPVTTWKMGDIDLYFRADLNRANDVPVYPGEAQVYFDTMHQLVKNVTIAVKETEDNSYYSVEAFEITNKMLLAYSKMFGSDIKSGYKIPTFDVQFVDQYAYLPGKIQNPIIAIVHPDFANETSIRNEGHVTYISGQTYEELDLAVVKFLMIALDIEV